MGFFDKKPTKVSSGGGSSRTYNATIIADDCVIVGGITAQSDVVINGNFEGAVSSNQTVTVGEKGEFYGEVKAQTIVIGGLVDGVVDAEMIHILSTGRVIGQILYSKITIEENGFFDGKTIVKGSSLQSRYSEVENKYHNVIDTKVVTKEA
ncbi:MAG: polymer-forming cytoskeletal protein [Sulfuricurvum sp.]|jgi:cytoskeletal protein CcmA (bactofilin family)|uniref:bactofilin family protein n=1 Tax=Sulfuricurvum sp. TaxID=2025608 RepID=UPI0025E39E70|nr:polymer-forming cytoskeletal protein [Sulfuricurvum sp.]MCI4406908.1 polymer-forming cytoskeletal protein [Sulfuricurvum sp.]